ncbi:hypothetical protein [Streptomyces sp. Qhu_M48]|uniref:hypothetical protein n=1 Tax=Streptomyces sp. Qhu_M48 TaxID=3435889 RepID=UPI003F50977A
MTDEAGKVTDRGPVSFRFVRGTPEAYLRTTLLARDTSGKLWAYDSVYRDSRLIPVWTRQQIGHGWGICNAIL